MPWATVFLPDHIRQLINLETSLELKRASGFNMSSDAVNFLNAISLSTFPFSPATAGKCFSRNTRDTPADEIASPYSICDEFYVTCPSWFHILNARACDHRRPAHRACPARYGSERPAGRARARRAPARSSAPEDCA